MKTIEEAQTPELRIKPLGGIGTFGANCLLLQDRASGQAIIVDCGIRFLHGEEAADGDFALPDLRSIEELGSSLCAYIITHGHLDHIGGLPFSDKVNAAPIYATPFTSSLIQNRFSGHGKMRSELHTILIGERLSIGPFDIKWVAVNHSIPDAAALCIETPAGRVIHSGDFRIEPDPIIGPATDLAAIKRFGANGVLCLIADSTLAGNDEDNPGERSVIPALEQIFKQWPGRIFVATFSNHIQRIAAVLQLCEQLDRYVFFVGKSMLRAVNLAREHSLLPHTHRIISIAAAPGYMPHQLCGIVSGCQGEPQGSMARLASGALPHLHLVPGDRVIFSCRVIPGNEQAVSAIQDQLTERSIQWFDGSEGRHVSGHGGWPDLKMLLQAARPRVFIAAHGGDSQLLQHRMRVEQLVVNGRSPQILPLQNGESTWLYAETCTL